MSPPKRGVPIRTKGRPPPPSAKEEAELQPSDAEESVSDTQTDKVDDHCTNGPESDITRLRCELALVRAELAQLKQQQQPTVSAAPDQPLPITETPPKNSRQLQLVGPYLEDTLSQILAYDGKHQVRSEKTPKIEDLSDGINPTFRQWQASVQDRLDINSDHYRNERERMALVWGHSTGLAKEYLEPCYLSDTPQDRFQNAEQMIDLLKSYFLTGNEAAESRFLFDRLQMREDETFALFKARFLSAAVKGEVPRSEWFHYLWSKITPSLRIPNLGFKHLWDNSFNQMVEHLTAYDTEEVWEE